MIPREADYAAKQESNDDAKISKASSSSTTTAAATTTTSWSRLKDPRIVRVSRALGGKDRHSKVCTVRGLRDRRVRLSVPTAIQLYDLQERLGLNQPSKVVDWLLNAAKNEIDELPPLQIPQGISFTQMLNSHHFVASHSDKQGGNQGEGKETDDHQSWTRIEEEKHEFNSFLSRQNLMSGSFGRWDPSNLTLSQTPISLGLAGHHHQHEYLHNLSTVYQSGMITQPYFSNAASFHNSSELSSSSLAAAAVRPMFNFNMSTADLLTSQSNAVDEQSKRDDLHSS